MKIVKVGLLGFGTVGAGVAKVLLANSDIIAKKAGVKLEVKKALVRDLSKKRDIGDIDVTDNPDEILNDPDIEIVAEVMGGVDPALAYINRALDSGKNVVTANKELIASNGNGLRKSVV